MSTCKIGIYACILFLATLCTNSAFGECPCKKRKFAVATSRLISEENRNYFAPMKMVENQRANILKGSNSNTKKVTSKKQKRLRISEIRRRRIIAKFGLVYG